MKITHAWIKKQAKSNPSPEWTSAINAYEEMKIANKRSPAYYIKQERAVKTLIRAMVANRGMIDSEALFIQCFRDLDNNMANRVNYDLEFRYDVALGYLSDIGYIRYERGMWLRAE